MKSTAEFTLAQMQKRLIGLRGLFLSNTTVPANAIELYPVILRVRKSYKSQPGRFTEDFLETRLGGTLQARRVAASRVELGQSGSTNC